MSRTFFRKFFPAVPRAAGRPAFRASALRGGEFGIIRAPGAARAGNPPAHRMPTTPARRSGRMGGMRAGGRRRPGVLPRPAPQPRRFAPTHRRGRFSFLYISKEIGAHLRARSPFAFIAQAALPPVAGFPLFASAKLLAEGAASRKKNGRHWSISSTSGRFRLFQYRYGLGTTEHFGRESISAAFGSTMYAQAPRPRSYNQKRREPLTQPSS